jgi:dienelactone hydrolase
MGAAAAEFLAATQNGARGAILMHGALAPASMGVDAWPAVPTEVHYAIGDPLVDLDQVRELARMVRATNVRLPAGGHLFADDDSADYALASANLMVTLTLSFLITP